MKKTVLMLLASLSCFASAATINVGGAPAARLGVAPAGGGTLLSGANTFYMTAGTYTTPPVDFASAIAGLNPLRAVTTNAIVSVGSTAPGTVGAPSTIGGSFVGVGPGELSGAAFYLLISNSQDYTTATQVAVIRSVATLFPNPVSGAGTVSATSSITAWAPVVGGFTDSTTDFVTLVAVPEPSTALLGLLGLAGLVRRRR
jgi:MYXO-CTERM domain-containing protein